MNRGERFFKSLTVGDVMNPTVLELSHDLTLVPAARLLSLRSQSVAPVTDPKGRCVGVLWAEDCLRWFADVDQADEPNAAPTDCVWCDWQIVDVRVPQRDEVRWHMTRDPVLVTKDTRLTEIAEILLVAHRDSVVVVDDEQRPVGIVTSKDALAALTSSLQWPDEEPSARDPVLGRFPHRRTVQPSART